MSSYESAGMASFRLSRKVMKNASLKFNFLERLVDMRHEGMTNFFAKAGSAVLDMVDKHEALSVHAADATVFNEYVDNAEKKKRDANAMIPLERRLYRTIPITDKFRYGLQLGKAEAYEFFPGAVVIGMPIKDSSNELLAERSEVRRLIDFEAGTNVDWQDTPLVLRVAEYEGELTLADQMVRYLRRQKPGNIDVYNVTVQPGTLRGTH